ncbi:hypothetical protein BDV38DRAFT_37239 [Aspergillus pseudotamarii]|uniref:Uncharacterized protein n=1 Tax=Aspergillus pseudotamarii TaxID=132259 RepID=A0A5N6SCZ7_ASPPS|nr:uncharacterized protein BDV38DRAFT_37239 [Aspergillus pseudotamarii]KAE8130984.1 hypothetical protein BDV38DRAFT_37239 [Aspergillus pseudotamarii]
MKFFLTPWFLPIVYASICTITTTGVILYYRVLFIFSILPSYGSYIQAQSFDRRTQSIHANVYKVPIGTPRLSSSTTRLQWLSIPTLSSEDMVIYWAQSACVIDSRVVMITLHGTGYGGRCSVIMTAPTNGLEPFQISIAETFWRVSLLTTDFEVYSQGLTHAHEDAASECRLCHMANDLAQVILCDSCPFEALRYTGSS